MTTPLLFALGTGIIFLLVEMVTATFYGLSLGIAAFIVALYVWISWDTSLMLLHALLFLSVSALLSYFLPKFLSPEDAPPHQWLDKYLGETRKVKKVWEDFRVVLDGIEYTVEAENIAAWKTIRLTGRKWLVFQGEIL